MREVRCGGWFWWDAALAVVLALFMNAALAPPSRAVMRYGPLQISGNLETYNLVRTPDIGWNPTTGWNKVQPVMNRNSVRLRIDWDWFQNGRLIDRLDLPFIERSKLFLLYRGVYDGFYDIAPTNPQMGQTRYDDLVGGPIAGNTPGQCVGGACAVGTASNLPQLQRGIYSRFSGSNRTDAKFENDLREAYVDFKLKDAPLSFRIGRQQIIWGESDQFRVMDCWNPLDIGWHFQIDSWDEIRVPEWVGKGLWEIGDLGPLSNTFLEVVYNPFDFHNGVKNAFLPRPWAVPFPDPLRPGQVQDAGNGFLVSPQFNLEGTSLAQGDFKRNPQDASEVGVRFHSVTPQGLEFTLNYLYGRGRGLGGGNTLAFKIDQVNFPQYPFSFKPAQAVGFYQDPSLSGPKPVYPIDVTGRIMMPYQHIFGTTANYFDGDFTQAVWRLETAYVMDSPFNTRDPSTLIPITYTGPSGALIPLSPYPCTDKRANCAPLGYTKRGMWTGMFGFDRPTWIRILNPRATWFLTAQFFWTYTNGDVDYLVGNAGAGDSPYKTDLGMKSVGQWKSGPYGGLVERQQYGSCPGPGCGNGDNIRRWEHLLTFAGTSFYRSGTLVPFYAFAWDPVNDNSQVWMSLTYYYSNNFIISLYENLFWTYGSKAPSNDSEYTGGRFDRRDESGIKLTYQF
jgi:hypothetical protein